MVTGRTEVLALIPARGGSKGLPGKNIKPLAGFPLIAYSVAAGLQSKLVTRTIVSTDSEEIAAVARQRGAEVPFLRPAELAQDRTTDWPVFEHALRALKSAEGYQPDILVQLRPTSPFRPLGCVDQAVSQLLEDPSADSVRTVTPSGENPYKMWRLVDGHMEPLITCDLAEPYNMPRQALPATYWQTGHLDVFRRTTVLDKRSLSGDRILPLVIDRCYAIDIDNQEQWDMAQWLLAHRPLEMIRP